MIEGLSGNRHEGHVIVSDSADRTIAWTCNSLISDRDADEEYISPEDQANARLISSAPELLNAIEVAGRIVGQVQDSQFATKSERDYALSRASDALGGTYFKATGQALKWWEYEPTARLEDYLRKAKGVNDE